MILLAAYETNGHKCEEFKWHKVENPPPHPGYAPNAALHGCMQSKDMLKSLLILNCKP